MFCLHCGKEIPDHSSFCLGCGKAVHAGSQTEPNKQSIAPNARRSGVKTVTIFFTSLLTLYVIFAIARNNLRDAAPGIPTSLLHPFNRTLLSDSVMVLALQYQYWKFEVSTSAVNAHIVGNFHTAGGVGNDIEAVVAEWGQCENWLNGHQAQVLYASGKVTNGTMDVPIRQPGTYCLAFSNKMSLVSAKTVSGNINLQYLLP